MAAGCCELCERQSCYCYSAFVVLVCHFGYNSAYGLATWLQAVASYVNAKRRIALSQQQERITGPAGTENVRSLITNAGETRITRLTR